MAIYFTSTEGGLAIVYFNMVSDTHIYGLYEPNTKKYLLKGIVQRDLTGVETRLKQSVLLSLSVNKFSFWILKVHHHEKSIKPASAS